MRLRSIVAVPAGDLVDAALASPADAVALTLTDAGHAVSDLREAARHAFPRIREAGKRALLFVNHPRTRLLRDDLDALVTPDLAAVLLPHANDPQDVRDLAVLLREFEYTRGIEPGTVLAFPVVDSARGVLRAPELASAVPRAGGLVFDSRSYAADVGARDEERGDRLAYARGAVVAASRAYDGQPLVAAGPTELLSLAQYGFAGAILPGPAGAGAANASFRPASAAVEAARQKLDAYNAARAEGAWVARYGTGVVDAHVARKARALLDG
ncbi:MAG: hypothetical protein IT303_16970 [Dehalococcoidia bacterium]|nr:hypothetical protein [Dehalococcoidia bacterium]